ncbi:MAG: murein biosynthesis integral membrane protein MurJ [Candidatus Omnitrophica bacterium]|nr:murein biosynthesis integral membrane protein MurJ [Candidatus Omnitrophota bacterium]
MTHKGILKSAGTIGGLTTISRICGYFRDASLAIVLGAGGSMDAFTIAFRLANLFRRLLGEGAMMAAFVPVFAEYRANHSSEELWKFVSKFFYTLALVLVGVVTLQMVFSPTIVSIMSPGFMKVAGKWELTVFLNRLMAPYLFFVGLAAVLMAVLNSMKSYAVSAANPIFFNLMVIFSAFTLAKAFDDPAVGIAIGVLFGGVLQMLVQVPAAWQKGMRFVPSISFRHPAIQRISTLMIPGMVGIGIYQINLLVDSIMGSLLPEGSVSAIYYSNRVVELVQGIFIVSFATVILTEMSRHAAQKNEREMKETLSFSLRMVSFVTIPASLGLAILAQPITQVLFQHGNFNATDTERTAFALVFYAIGIFFVAGARIVVQAFYAIQDTKTPVRCAFVSLVVNLIGNWLLMHPLKQGGIALATSLAAAVNFFQLLSIYQKRFGLIDWEMYKDSFVRILTQSIAMAFSCTIFLKLFHFEKQEHLLGQALALFGTIGISLLVYLAFAMILKSKELAAFSKVQPPAPSDADIQEAAAE